MVIRFTWQQPFFCSVTKLRLKYKIIILYFAESSSRFPLLLISSSRKSESGRREIEESWFKVGTVRNPGGVIIVTDHPFQALHFHRLNVLSHNNEHNCHHYLVCWTFVTQLVLTISSLGRPSVKKVTELWTFSLHQNL